MPRGGKFSDGVCEDCLDWGFDFLFLTGVEFFLLRAPSTSPISFLCILPTISSTKLSNSSICEQCAHSLAVSASKKSGTRDCEAASRVRIIKTNEVSID